MTWRALGHRVKALREARGLSQAELGRRARLSGVYIQKIELGERVSPSFQALDRIARALGATLRVELVGHRRRRRG